jgi:hypothetical protein
VKPPLAFDAQDHSQHMPAKLEVRLETRDTAFRAKKGLLVFRRRESAALYTEAEKHMSLKIEANSIMFNEDAQFIGGLATNQVLFSADSRISGGMLIAKPLPVAAGNQLLFGMVRRLPDDVDDQNVVAHHNIYLVQPEPCQGLEALFATTKKCAEHIQESTSRPKPSKTDVVDLCMKVLLQLENSHVYQSHKLTFESNNNAAFLKGLGDHRLTDDVMITLTRFHAAPVAA